MATLHLGLPAPVEKKHKPVAALFGSSLKPQSFQQDNISDRGRDESADSGRGDAWVRFWLELSLGLLLIPPQIPKAQPEHPDGQISCFHVDPSAKTGPRGAGHVDSRRGQ